MKPHTKTDAVLIDLMKCVDGTTTSPEGVTLFYAMEKVLKNKKVVKLSLRGATPLSSSFLNSSFGELHDKYGHKFLSKHIMLVNFLPSQAVRIRGYLKELDKLVR